MTELIPEAFRLPGTYELFRQRRGSVRTEFLVTLYSFRNVHNVLRMWADQERTMGLRIEDTDGGFITYMKKGKTLISFAHYWYEEVVPDDAVQIDADLMDAISVACETAAAEVRQAEMDAETDYRRDAE